MANIKTKYKGIFQNGKGKYGYNTKRVLSDGTTIREHKEIYNTAKEAFIAKETFMSNDEQKYYILRSKALDKCLPINTMGTLARDYLAHYKPTVRVHTYDGAIIFVKHIAKFFDFDIPLEESLTEETIKSFKKLLYESDQFSIKRKNEIMCFFKKMVEFGFLLEHITQSQLSKTKLLLNNFIDQKITSRSVDFWTFDEWTKFINVIPKDSVWYVYYNTLYFTGMRKSEALAISPSCLDYNRKTLSVKSQMQYINGKPTDVILKTKNSEREILLPEHLLLLLQDYIDSLCLGKEDKLFKMSKSVIQRNLKANCEKAGVKKIRIHDFRHSHTSLLINLGADLMIIKERLGHASIEETASTYGHLFPNRQRDIINLLETK